MIVVSDTSPLNYLILIDAVELLPRLNERVILPEAARRELEHPDAPPAVSRWVRDLPAWIDVRAAPAPPWPDPALLALGSGERDAIILAEFYRRDFDVLLLLDEDAARRYGSSRSLMTTGTLGVLRSASYEGWIDLAHALEKLRRTNFRVSARLLADLLEEHAARGRPGP